MISRFAVWQAGHGRSVSCAGCQWTQGSYHNAGWMVDQRRQFWPTIQPTLADLSQWLDADYLTTPYYHTRLCQMTNHQINLSAKHWRRLAEHHVDHCDKAQYTTAHIILIFWHAYCYILTNLFLGRQRNILFRLSRRLNMWWKIFHNRACFINHILEFYCIFHAIAPSVTQQVI